MIYYTSWKRVSSPKQSLPLFSSTDGWSFAKPSLTMPATIGGRVICRSHIITTRRTINRRGKINCASQLLSDQKFGMCKKERSVEFESVIFINYRQKARSNGSINDWLDYLWIKTRRFFLFFSARLSRFIIDLTAMTKLSIHPEVFNKDIYLLILNQLKSCSALKHIINNFYNNFYNFYKN